ncbi:hydrolase [Pseudoalteromonas sp. NBT06-2]|uniref:hydrolase n=1 Tax=Pseudoalteromonas sp. NBT06-2 TaxID=2025950 RepID=UPI000BA6250C|nr:hydrolase [Pseudoalteromonas sp. NBT06-2]PAJ73049.1 hydrolase [Pseudoalteromonas sp. NBT06-2]
MSSHFRPAWWMVNKHAQTILPRFFRPKLKLTYELESLTTPDQDFIELAWSCPVAKNNNKPLAIIFHGLEGNIHSFYAKGMMKAMQDSGFDTVLMHFRNCSVAPNKTARAYHSGETSDARFLIQYLKQKFPEKKMVAIGFSLGGNMLSKYLGEYQNDSQLDAGAVISAPFDLASSCQVIQQSLGKIYQKYLLDRLKHSTGRKESLIEPLLGLNKQDIKNIPTLWEFDDKVTAPLHGFKNAKDYYNKASSKAYLIKIETPTLIIHSVDDPMLSIKSVPDNSHISEHVELNITEKGGHVGFISGKNPFKPIFWLEQRIPEYFKKQLNIK